MAKEVTYDQAERKKDKAAQFLDRIGQSDRADEFRDMSVDEYADRKKLLIANPKSNRRSRMPNTDTKVDLQDNIDSAIDTLEQVYAPESSREELASAVGDALDILRGDSDEDNDTDSDDDSDDDLD